MTRVLLLLVMLVMPLGSDPRAAANTFADSYNQWVEMMKVRKMGTIDVREIRLWKETQENWKRLNQEVKYTDSSSTLPLE